MTTAGRFASSTDPSTWTDYSAAKASRVGVGMGFVLNGDGVSCIDLDHCVVGGKPNEQAQALMNRFPSAWVELSPSGTGLHLWGNAPGGPGRRTNLDGLDVEFYSTGRYITVTGRAVRAGNLSTNLDMHLV